MSVREISEQWPVYVMGRFNWDSYRDIQMWSYAVTDRGRLFELYFSAYPGCRRRLLAPSGERPSALMWWLDLPTPHYHLNHPNLSENRIAKSTLPSQNTVGELSGDYGVLWPSSYIKYYVWKTSGKLETISVSIIILKILNRELAFQCEVDGDKTLKSVS